MERVNDSRKSLLTNIIDSYQLVRSRPNINLYPQMPSNQIVHYIKQTVRKNHSVIIQLNPNSRTNLVNEVMGEIKLSPSSSHIILTSHSNKTVHLIQPQHIRHLRIAK